MLPRGAYEVDLRPGWNLVSFPGEPVDTAIDSVLPADHPAIEVLTYEAGLWIASVREPGQPWEGDVTDIDGQHAYWINSTSSGTLEAVLIEPGTGEASRPPAFQLIVGWNLIPVTDLDQGEAGKTTHDDYFTSMSNRGRLRQGLRLRRADPQVGATRLQVRGQQRPGRLGLLPVERSLGPVVLGPGPESLP